MANLREHWTLDPAIDYLNHGSFGACPKAVLDKQREYRDLMEREPMDFLERECWELINDSRRTLADFIGAPPDQTAFVHNATTGVNTVLRSLDFAPGDELLTTTHIYGACKNAMEFVAKKSGAKVVYARLPFPVESPGQAVESIMSCVTDRTRFALIDHITAPTAMVLPVKELTAKLQARGVEVMIDGAHAPGMTRLNMLDIGAQYYTGNCHKWLCSPKGSAFLYVREDRLEKIRPLVISHGATDSRTDRPRFQSEFCWQGTDDPTAYLCVAESIKYMEKLLPGGWDEIMRRNHELALAARNTLCGSLEIPAPCPDKMIGSMAALPLGKLPDLPPSRCFGIHPLQDLLRREHNFEVIVNEWPAPHHAILRVSAQLYNRESQYERLAKVLKAM